MITTATNQGNCIIELKLRYVREHIKEALTDIENGNVEDGESFFIDLMAGKYDKV
ncbi:MAG: hypothetical protein FWF87_01110 [Synergistaceae bacterium]|nr:hypothetical protein [Synergistaceae bacterium]